MNAPRLTCPLCQGTGFRREEAHMDGRWRRAAHRLVLMVCLRCAHVLPFYEADAGHSVFELG